MPKVAVLIDGGFFLKRYPYCYGKQSNPEIVATHLHEMAIAHLERKRGDTLHRILYYDCPPLLKKAHRPISRTSIDFSKSEEAKFRLELHEQLKRKRKVALRLGHLGDGDGWLIRPRITKELLSGKKKFDDLEDDDLFYSMRQKGVDIKIGVDISSMALKRLVDKIILVSGDADFVPAAKLARREGIDFVLDPMWGHIQPGLIEHIDGLASQCPRPEVEESS